jgi:gluconate 2-dehydrogenase alpha chain
VVPPTVPSWGREYRRYVKENWNRTGLLLANVETLPYEHNRLVLRTDAHDRRGRPLLAAQYTTGINEKRLVDHLLGRMVELAEVSGADIVWPLRTEVVPSQHDAGGTRMGDDPQTSVVDRWGRSHESRNLFVLGPSVFPTASGLNPSVTIQALAWRAAEFIEQSCL